MSEKEKTASCAATHGAEGEVKRLSFILYFYYTIFS